MIQTPRIAYRARDDATPEIEVSALAAIYRLALKERDRLPDKSGPGDGTKVKEDSANEHRST